MVYKTLFALCCLGVMLTAKAQNTGSSANEITLNNLAQSSNWNNLPGFSNIGNYTHMVPGGASMPSVPGVPSGSMPGVSNFSGMSAHGQQQMTQMMADPCTWKTMANMAQAMSSSMQQSQSTSSSGSKS